MAAVTLLEARGLSRHFGGVRAVEAVDLDLRAGEIHALIGPNGAGKTTLVGLISGRLRPDAEPETARQRPPTAAARPLPPPGASRSAPGAARLRCLLRAGPCCFLADADPDRGSSRCGFRA